MLNRHPRLDMMKGRPQLAASSSLPLPHLVRDREGKLLNRIDAAVGDDRHNDHPVVQQITRGLKCLLSSFFNDLDDAFRRTRLALNG